MGLLLPSYTLVGRQVQRKPRWWQATLRSINSLGLKLKIMGPDYDNLLYEIYSRCQGIFPDAGEYKKFTDENFLLVFSKKFFYSRL